MVVGARAGDDDCVGYGADCSQGATHVWANVHTYAAHPLQTARRLDGHGDVLVVGQAPRLADWADDKALLGAYLRGRAGELDVAVPDAVVVSSAMGVDGQVGGAARRLGLPVVVKPRRGRGSSGVKRCGSLEELGRHVGVLLREGESVVVEEYLGGEEGTIAVLPPAMDDPKGRYMALPFVERFDQTDGVMAYSGKTPVSVNSCAKTMEEIERDRSYGDAMRQCEVVADLLKARAAVRIDVRRGKNGRFRVFDVNVKPVSHAWRGKSERKRSRRDADDSRTSPGLGDRAEMTR